MYVTHDGVHCLWRWQCNFPLFASVCKLDKSVIATQCNGVAAEIVGYHAMWSFPFWKFEQQGACNLSLWSWGSFMHAYLIWINGCLDNYLAMVRQDMQNIKRWICWRCGCIRLRSCLFCEGRISVLKRWFKTPIQNAVHGSTVYASLEKKTISWACTAHCSRLLFELKWTGKAFIWRHLNVVICDFAFMLPPESAFCSNHDRKRTFLGCVHAYFAKAESAFWNADSKRRSKTPFTGVLFMLPSRRRRFREHALRIVRGYCSSSSEPERRLYDVI